MKRRLTSLTFIGLVVAFAAGLLCSSMAAPSLALASVTGCSQMPGRMAMAGCERPSYLCGFDSANNLLSRGAIGSSRSNDSLKDALGLALATPAIDVSSALAPPGSRGGKNISLAEPGKVSVRLFNSVLNL